MSLLVVVVVRLLCLVCDEVLGFLGTGHSYKVCTAVLLRYGAVTLG
jgi:hypothetical protein